MKKIILIVFSFLLITTGCNSIMNTPTKKTEEFFKKYQNLDKEVINQLDLIIEKNINNYDDEQKVKYKEIIKKQYNDLKYTIKEEMIDGNNATVTVEIEVYDYNTIINNAEKYYIENQSVFIKEKNEVDTKKYIDYKLNQLENPKDRIKYTLYITLSRNEKEWIINNITEEDRLKIQGLYNN